MPSGLGKRLRRIRTGRGQSLRDFAGWLEDQTGYSVSHESVRQYEEGDRVVPSGYVRAVSRACEVSAEWLLSGKGSVSLDEQSGDLPISRPSDDERVTDDPASEDAAWAGFLRSPKFGDVSIRVITSRLCRAMAAADARRTDPPSLDVPRLGKTLEHGDGLVSIAAPHLAWVSELAASTAHAAYLTDGDGIVLHSVGDQESVRLWCVEPGHDWSADDDYTNGAGPALVSGEVAVVVGDVPPGPDDPVCLAAPVVPSDGTTAGVVGLCLERRGGSPGVLLAPAYAATMIALSLDHSSGD